MADGAKQPGEESTKESVPQSPRSIDESRFPSSRSPSLRLGHMSNSASPHRQSFSESLRGMPSSPRSQRHPSLSQAGVQELLNNPPVTAPSDPAFAGRDWRTIQVGELVNAADLRFVELDTGVEAATNVGEQNALGSRRLTVAYEGIAPHRIRCSGSSDSRDSHKQIRSCHLRLQRPECLPPPRCGTGTSR